MTKSLISQNTEGSSPSEYMEIELNVAKMEITALYSRRVVLLVLHTKFIS